VPWFRDTYADAVWECASLRPIEKIVALTYAQHAGAPKPKADSDVSWVVWRRLSQLTGIRSKTTLSKVTRALEAAGWLVLVEEKKQHKSPRYRLVIPESSEVRETYVWDGDLGPSEVRELDNNPVDIPAAEVQEMDNSEGSEVAPVDNSTPPVVHVLAPEVQGMTARGSGTGPDSSKDTSTTDNPSASSAQPQDARPVCKHPHWTADGDCVKCGHHEPCPDCRRLARIGPTIRCYRHQEAS
jgi:hypothetical protein